MAGRTYRYFKGDALFPFGHGLSYTTFSISKPVYKNGKVRVKVTNTGKTAGTETVQVYIRRMADTEGPLKTLRGYARATLLPQETKTVEIDLPREQFEGWDEVTNTMRVVPGQYAIMVGNSSAKESLQVIKTKIK